MAREHPGAPGIAEAATVPRVGHPRICSPTSSVLSSVNLLEHGARYGAWLIMAKLRAPVPTETAVSILFLSDRTCCVCRERGKPIQIHHVDENPSNNKPENLSVLCLHCHEATQIRGGFGRKLDAAQIVRYRDDWYRRVRKRRDLADQVAAQNQAAPAHSPRSEQHPRSVRRRSPRKLAEYVRSLPGIRRDAYRRAAKVWNIGGRQNLKQGLFDISDVMERILVALASWYPPLHFDGREPRDYMNDMKASRFTWHFAHLQPKGSGTAGDSVGVEAPTLVLNDLEEMVVMLVRSLSSEVGAFDIDGWVSSWEAAEKFAEDPITLK